MAERDSDSDLPGGELDEEAKDGSGTELTLLDACGLQCPGPILKVYEAVKALEEGQKLEVTATDFGFARDIEAWCLKTGNTLESLGVSQDKVKAVVRKGYSKSPAVNSQ
ncbi:sulfurtransferase TusA family protein [Paenibacillus sp. RC343]|nr:sulfurtransferase TusA family protein [Paenibacillus sp. RC343]